MPRESKIFGLELNSLPQALPQLLSLLPYREIPSSKHMGTQGRIVDVALVVTLLVLLAVQAAFPNGPRSHCHHMNLCTKHQNWHAGTADARLGQDSRIFTRKTPNQRSVQI